jgi:riboflavin synthase
VIPETRSATTMGAIEVGDTVNLEVDVVAKYVERLLATRDQESA